jgi:acyl carrier protein
MTSMAPSRDAIKSFVFDTLTEYGAERESLTTDAHFDDLEIDSLDMVEIGMAINKTFSLSIKPKEFDGKNTIGKVLEVIYDKAGVQ